MSTDPLGAAIEAAVERALAAQIPNIIVAVKSASSPAVEEADRFVLIGEAARRLGMSPSSISRLEKQGRLPVREKVAGRTGYRNSTLKAILAGISTAPLPAPPKAIRPGERRGGKSQKRGRA